MNETYFFRLLNGQWFQFTGTPTQCERLFKTFKAIKQPVQGWTTGAESFVRQYGITVSEVPSIS